MADLVFNVAKGKVNYYSLLPAANDAIIVVPLLAAGIVSDATMRDYATLSAILAGNTENTTVGRKTLAGVTVTVDNTNDRADADSSDIVWTAPAASGAVACLVFCYDDDTTSGTDANLIPLVKLDCAWTPDGIDFTAAVANFYRAS